MGGELKDKKRSRLKGSKDKRGWGRWLEFKARRRVLHPVDFALRKFMVAKQLLSNGAADQISLSRKEGWARIEPGTLPLTKEVVDSCVSLFHRRKPELEAVFDTRASKSDTYFYDVAAEQGFGEVSDLLIEYVTQPALLNSVIRYLGDFPIFQGASLYWTPPNSKAVSSQLWHLDNLDSRQVKFFLYLNDIDKGAGPTTILPIGATQEVVKRTGYDGGKISDEEVAACVPPENWIVLEGPKETLIACDTSSCLHFGGRARERERLFVMFHYSTSAPFAFEKRWKVPARNLRERLLFAASPGRH